MNEITSRATKTFIVFLTTFFCCLNVTYFLSLTANPLILSDAWYFFDVNIMKWITDGLSVSDFFVKRSIDDHAQPLNKIFLYANYKFFNLDFRWESLAGLLGLFSIIFFFTFLFFKKLNSNSVPIKNILMFFMALMVITSLNSTELYTWSLVTFSFLTLSIAFTTAWFTWRSIKKNTIVAPLLFFLFSILFIGDTASIILWLSMATTLILVCFNKEQEFRRKTFTWLLLSGILTGSIFLIINWTFLTAESTETAHRVNNLILTDINTYLEVIRIIFSSSIMHGIHLANFENHKFFISWAISIPIIFFYLKHFIDLILKKTEIKNIDFLVTFILIYASLSITAILFGRISYFGIEYLNQPRYVLIYQLIPFALFIKWAFSEKETVRKHRWQHMPMTLLFLIFMSIQYSISIHAYCSVPWIWRWYAGQVKVIDNYLKNPTIPTGNCTDLSKPLCDLSIDKRNDLLKTLKTKQLNLFNTNFQHTYRLIPTSSDPLAQYIDLIPEPTHTKYFLKSSGMASGPSHVSMENGTEDINLLRGFTVIGLNPLQNPVKLAHIDTCAHGTQIQDAVKLDGNFKSVMDKHQDDYDAFAILVHDSALCGNNNFSQLFDGLNLEKWKEIGFRTPYIGIIMKNESFFEFSGEENASLARKLTLYAK